MADRHTKDVKSKTQKDSKDGHKTRPSGAETIIAGCPILLQTGPNIKVLAQVIIMYIYMYYQFYIEIEFRIILLFAC